MRPRCKVRDHVDRRKRGGRSHECIACGDPFPCRGDCEHGDCCVATGRPLPEMYGPTAWDAIATDLVVRGYFAFISDVPRPPQPTIAEDDFGAP